MKISSEIPQIYQKCHEVFGVNWNDGVVITYGDTVYCRFPLSEDLKIHEATHIKQQAEYGVEKWWDRYFVDKEFRLEQEVEAHKNQLQYARENCSRNYRKMLEKHIYKTMASMYAGMCTEEEAKKLLSS